MIRMKRIVCFGEVLWDMLPSGKMPGGAPMNVAIHLQNLGNRVHMISRIGADDLGIELLRFMKEAGLDTRLIQQGQTHLTGVVKVNMDDRNNVQYKILHPVAWDYITLEEQAVEEVRMADAFIFGSLAARSALSFRTLKALLPHARKKVLDINLRPPNYDKETLEFLLKHTDILKLNHHELDVLSGFFSASGNTPEEQALKLSELFGLESICITLGEEGAMVYQNGQFFFQGGFEVEVSDTIGSGDSFLATWVSGILKGAPVAAALSRACAVGALVATHRGATPFISESQISDLLNNNKP